MDFTPLLKQQRDFFLTGATFPVEFRLAALRRLSETIQTHEPDILAALHRDLRKPPQEAYGAEIGLVVSEIHFAIRRLKKWARPQRRKSSRMAWPARSQVVPEPRGVALIVGPWNYPVQLLLSPLVGAIAAGNCAVLKASELAPNTAAAVADVIRDAFPENHIALVQGGRDVSQALLLQKFDTIFFTGSSGVGREIMSAAARHLTPVTLELGGKCPCIVCADAPVDVVARRIIWGKLMNAGQTCVAPDYVLVEAAVRDALVAALKSAIEGFYTATPRQSPNFGRIINRRHFDRLTGYLTAGKIAAGGESDAGDLYIAPTILTDVPPDAPVLNEEIFGPILPVHAVNDLASALQFVSERPTPLSAYLFTKDRAIQHRVTRQLRSGGLCINDTVVHMLGKDLPFGGLGESGIGMYHGKASFDVFTHFKTVVRCTTAIDVQFRYPPPRFGMKTFKKLLGFLLKS